MGVLLEGSWFRVLSRTVNTFANVSGSVTLSESYAYDDNGNLTSKGNVGYYQYNVAGKPNRLAAIWQNSNFTGTQNYAFSYDANGNVLSDGKRSYTYTSFDKPSLITQGTNTTSFSYGPSRQLIKRVDTRSGQTTSTVMIDGLYEQVTLPSGVVEHKYFVGDAVVTKRTGAPAGDMLSVKYLLKDHLGSTIAVLNDQGVVLQQFIYDPWGKQYNVYSNTNLMLAYSSDATTKGYTGHEMVNDFDVIHMGGRTYNPVIGRFMQADPNIQEAGNLQNYNRYSYVLNNPMRYTDPTGYFLKDLIKATMKITGDWYIHKFLNSVPVLNSIATIAINFIPGCQVWCAAVWTAKSTFVATGSLRASLKAGAITAASAYTLQTIGGDSFWGQAGSVQNIFANALVGGITSELQGGKFGHGFFAAGVTSAFKPLVNKIGGGDANYVAARVIAAATIGGTASVISGDKFINGAVTGAFVQMFNGETALAKQRANRAKYEALSKRADVKAFLDTIAKLEGGEYNKRFGGGTFDDYSEHPGLTEYGSSAAGRYQILSGTWDHVSNVLGLEDFSPANQDIAATYLLNQLGVINQLDQGNLNTAFYLASTTWDAIPHTEHISGAWGYRYSMHNKAPAMKYQTMSTDYAVSYYLNRLNGTNK